MPFVRSLRGLWRHRLFRRLLTVRVATQTGDGVLQVALASYVLFSPQRQPDAAAIAGVLAVTLLPFTVLGPFAGLALDRWSRRQVLVVTDLARAALAVGLAALVATGLRTPGPEALFYLGVLLAMSLNRFLLAGLSAALPHTVEPGEYMAANAVMPTVGPAGVLLGVGIGTGLRLALGWAVPAATADAAVFAAAGLGFAVSAVLALRIPRDRLGPDVPPTGTAGGVLRGLGVALVHLRDRRAAGLGLVTLGAQRLVYGVITVAAILLYRNHFHAPGEVDAALLGLGTLAAAVAAGFVLAAVVAPVASARLGVRTTMVAALLACAGFQLLPGSVFTPGAQLAAGLALGLAAQTVKLCVDTLVQAHVDDELKGRVFTLYDMVFNLALVLAGALAAVILPPDGRSLPVFWSMAGLYLAVAGAFWVASRGLDLDAGTESLRAASLPAPTPAA